MKRSLLVMAAVVVASLQVSSVWADATPSPASSPREATGPRVASSPSTVTPTPTPSPTPDPAIEALKGRIGRDLAALVTKQQALQAAMDANTARQQVLNDQITAVGDKISQLTDEIAALDDQIQITQDQIDVEKGEVAQLARAMSRRPASLPLAFARARSLGDVLQTGTELIVAGRRAHTLQVKLEKDLAKLQADRAAKQADLDKQTALQDALSADLDQLTNLISMQSDLSAQVDDLSSQFQDALAGAEDVSAADTATLVDMLEQQQRDLNQASMRQAWSAANVGAGRVQLLTTHPVRAGELHMVNPNPTGLLTQGFGPTDLWFEPPLGKYPHFHYGVDIAAPEGTPILAAADGMVVAVGHTPGGYGNYVVVAHGGGVATLYGHLKKALVAVGQEVRGGQIIAQEGSTGFSTGPHLHFEVRVRDAVVDPAAYITLPPSSR